MLPRHLPFLILLCVVACEARSSKCGHDLFMAHPSMQARLVGMKEARRELLVQPEDEQVRATGILRIPIVWHVLTNRLENNITREAILQEMAWLNDWYTAKNTNYEANANDEFASIVASSSDFNIQFELAAIDPNGNAFEGINYVNGASAADGCNEENTFKTDQGGMHHSC